MKRIFWTLHIDCQHTCSSVLILHFSILVNIDFQHSFVLTVPFQYLSVLIRNIQSCWSYLLNIRLCKSFSNTRRADIVSPIGITLEKFCPCEYHSYDHKAYMRHKKMNHTLHIACITWFSFKIDIFPHIIFQSNPNRWTYKSLFPFPYSICAYLYHITIILNGQIFRYFGI